jgi:hypothetical protein
VSIRSTLGGYFILLEVVVEGFRFLTAGYCRRNILPVIIEEKYPGAQKAARPDHKLATLLYEPFHILFHSDKLVDAPQCLEYLIEIADALFVSLALLNFQLQFLVAFCQFRGTVGDTLFQLFIQLS